jgi:hypothetical protein
MGFKTVDFNEKSHPGRPAMAFLVSKLPSSPFHTFFTILKCGIPTSSMRSPTTS